MDLMGFLMSGVKGRKCYFDGKKKNVLFDNNIELVYITLYIVYTNNINYNIWYLQF